MKHTTEELLLAAKVREIAITSRKYDLPGGLDAAGVEAWINVNPLQKWIDLAIRDLEYVAGVIAKRSSQADHRPE